MKRLAMLISALVTTVIVPACFGFSIAPQSMMTGSRSKSCRLSSILQLSQSSEESGRRNFLSLLALSSWIVSQPARGDDDQSMTSMLFNADGSLKEGEVEVAKERTVEFKWDATNQGVVNIDGVTTTGSDGSHFKLTYNLPEKWTGDNLYLDSSQGVNAKACNHITVYKAPGKFEANQLDKATKIGVGKALDVTDSLDPLRNADLIGGRKIAKGDQTYYEFDMAVAPPTCVDSSENLGLGFCPFDFVYLLSATLMDGNLFVIAVECDKLEWKQANADLKRVRSSFTVEAL
jgi:hypothetical protein